MELDPDAESDESLARQQELVGEKTSRASQNAEYINSNKTYPNTCLMMSEDVNAADTVKGPTLREISSSNVFNQDVVDIEPSLAAIEASLPTGKKEAEDGKNSRE